MILLDYPGAKSQVLKRDGTVDYFCDTVGLLNALHDPDRAPAISRAFVQPFDGREWGSYADGWVKASEPMYVIGSRRMGAMGPALVPFRERENGEAFAAQHGGSILACEEITAQVMAEHARMVRARMRSGDGPAAAAGMTKHPAMPGMAGGKRDAHNN